jgi:thiol-disulfide isomerase/thioredoxin
MKTRSLWFIVSFILLSFSLVACSGGSGNETTGGANGRPEWQTIALTDVRSGETFSLGGFEDKVVIVEAMAVWCPLCTEQQQHIGAAVSDLGDSVVAVSLDIDPSETAVTLGQHADFMGFNWRFAVAGSELSGLLQNEFGPQILAPTSTPILIIAPDGTTELTPFGIKGWETLVEEATAYLP